MHVIHYSKNRLCNSTQTIAAITQRAESQYPMAFMDGCPAKVEHMMPLFLLHGVRRVCRVSNTLLSCYPHLLVRSESSQVTVIIHFN